MGMGVQRMTTRLSDLPAWIAHGIVLAIGIALLPAALLARQFGVTIPVHRLLDRTEPSA
jgi:hypothetical protein